MGKTQMLLDVAVQSLRQCPEARVLFLCSSVSFKELYEKSLVSAKDLISSNRLQFLSCFDPLSKDWVEKARTVGKSDGCVVFEDFRATLSQKEH